MVMDKACDTESVLRASSQPEPIGKITLQASPSNTGPWSDFRLQSRAATAPLHNSIITIMADVTFHLFVRLPVEIRRIIYLLATPQRIVFMQEETEDRDDFFEHYRERVREQGVQPSLGYFAHLWR